MTFNELHEEYMKMCDNQEDCSECKYDGNFPCQLSFGYSKGRADQKEEDNEFFNFEGAWELEKKKVRADVIDEFKSVWDERVKDLIHWCRDKRLLGLTQADEMFDEIVEQLKE